jgi:very-short-patch-repair endonuclease
MRALDPALVDHAIELYVGGQTLPQVSAELGIGMTTLSRKLRERGIETRGVRLRLPDETIVRRYQAGESVLAIARDLDVSRQAVERRLLAAGIEQRDSSAAGAMRASRMTREDRRRQAAAANAAVRGVPQPEERLVKAALTRQANPPRMSRHEQKLARWLRERHVAYVREHAVGRYNVDFTIGPVAVEVLGGEWHSTRVKTVIHGRRTPYLLDSGWALAFVWATSNYPLTAAVVDYLIAYADEARRKPTVLGEYRVIRGDAKLLTRGRREDYERTGIVPARDN